uniref:THAP-type domain-containing protein n=1 Tax=Globodera pallida TaxID=36090 RepID=A0A183CSH0_GLOPA
SSKNGSNLTSKCKRLHITADGKKIPPKDDCRPGRSSCYAIYCKNTNRNKEIMEWGCTSNMTKLYRQKVDEFGFELYKRCQFHAGPSNEEITAKELDSYRRSPINKRLPPNQPP